VTCFLLLRVYDSSVENLDMNVRKIMSDRFYELNDLIPKFALNSSSDIYNAANIIYDCFIGDCKLLICGNGGSAADSQHFAAEFVSSFSKDYKRRALPAISLSVDTSFITAYSNDFSFDNIFSRQVEAFAKKGDVLIVFTTSGSSKNCLIAAERAANLGIKVIAFTREKADISKFADVSISVPSDNTQHIQECHMIAYHIIAEIVEKRIVENIL